MSIQSIVRVTGVSKNTVVNLLVAAGAACQAYHDVHFRHLNSRRVQCDEIWAFCYVKQKNVASAKAAPADAGDVWTWTAIDADSKLAVSWLVGGRDAGYATEFMSDVAGRLSHRVQLTTDGHRAYLEAVESTFGADVDYAMLVKLYGAADTEHRYSPAQCIGAKQQAVAGPIAAHMIVYWLSQDSNITPPVCIAAFAGATIAQADMWKTAFSAFKFAKFLYLAPFLFGYVPAFSLGGSASDIMIAFVLIIIGTWGYSWLLSGIWLDRFTGGAARA